MEKKLLVVAAHPDDEILGCGGTLARLAREGWDCRVLILAEGVTARDDRRDPASRTEDLRILHDQARRAAGVVGVRETEVAGFPDNRMDGVDLLEVVKVVERALASHRPDLVFTHHGGDLNVDHQVTARAVETATRPLPEGAPLEVYAFEVLSSTEWAFGAPRHPFAPNCFFEISATLDQKLEAFRVYQSENRPFPYPRSPEAIRALAAMRGAQAGLEAAEAFSLVRRIVRCPVGG